MNSSDSWRTPQDLFEILDKGGVYQSIKFDGFNFDIDLCASKGNSKCQYYCVDYLRGLIENIAYKDCPYGQVQIGFSSIIHDAFHGKEPFKINTCFMNPPYSNPLPFIEKAWEDSKHCKIVCIYSELEYYADGELCPNQNIKLLEKIGEKPGCEVIFFPKRIKFDPPVELVNSGEAWKEGNSWVKGCPHCDNGRMYSRFHTGTFLDCDYDCLDCKGRGYTKLNGPSFASCLIIMDRRNV